MKGVMDVATLFPDIALEADDWDARTVVANSGKILPWRCCEGHAWDATVNHRTPPRNSGCPFCAGNKVLTGFNDLVTLLPELARQAHGWDPTTVSPGRDKKLKWKSDLVHEWKAPLNNRTHPREGGSPVCLRNSVLSGFTDLASKFH